MADMSGEDLGVRLKDLYIAASDKIPAMAEVYNNVNGKLAGTAESQGSAFDGGADSRIFGAWTGLRDVLQTKLAQTQTNLNDTSTTLVEVINHYANQDDAASTSLSDAVKNNNEDAHHPEDNPNGDKNLPPLPDVGDGQDPVTPPDTTEPTPAEDNY